jgi:hypothetical protein
MQKLMLASLGKNLLMFWKETKMKVYLCYDVSFDGGMGTYRDLRKIFDCEVKALLWLDEKKPVEYNDIEIEWREYEEKEVE